MNNPAVVSKLNSFFKTYNQRTYQKNAILIDSLQEPEGVFLLTEGVVRRYAVSDNGDEATLNIYKPYSFFPMDWVLNNSLTPHYYQALSTTKVSIASKENVKIFLQENPDVVMDLLSRIYSGLEGMFMRIEYLLFGKASANVIIQILILAKRLRHDPAESKVAIKITHNELAAQSGLARETVSREMMKLKRKKLIESRGSLIIIDIPKLEHFLSSE